MAKSKLAVVESSAEQAVVEPEAEIDSQSAPKIPAVPESGEALTPELTDEEAAILAHEGEAALREMGEEQLEPPAPFDIPVPGIRYEEVFITDYETDIPGLHDCLGEYENIDELNYLASLLDDMEEQEAQKFAAAVKFGEHTGSVRELINLAQNLDCYEFYPGIKDEEDLGRFYIEEMCTLEVPAHLENYIDYEAYGRDMDLDDNGCFVDGGYIVENGNSFAELYNGRDDLPEEHRIFAYPAPEQSIQKMLAEYRQTVSEAPAHERPRLADVER